MIGVSACLAGIYCRYDGKTNLIEPLQKLVAEGKAVTICPEVLGGLATPRTPAEICGGDGFAVWENKARVLSKKGEDVTEAFKTGAEIAYQKLAELKITELILKERSPSCGRHVIYDGSFSGTRQIGAGVATAYFLLKGIAVYSEEEWLKQQAKEVFDGD